MPIAFIIIGVVILVAAWRGTYTDLSTLVVGDFTGTNSFLVWLGAIGVIGAAGYSPRLQAPSRMLMALIVLSMFLANKGIWQQFSDALKNATPSATKSKPLAPLPGNPTITIQGGAAGGSGGIGDILKTGSALAGIAAAPETGGLSLVATGGLF